MKVALIHPEIPFNAGNVGRTCAAAGAELHLVAPLGFSLSERRLKRAGMDYWEKLAPKVHGSLDSFLSFIKDEEAAVLAFSAEGPRAHWDAPYAGDSWLVFGSESRGLPETLRARWRERLYRVPMVAGARSLNLSSVAAVVLYEALRRDHGPTRA
ncbi:MAG: tRNA (cytidine(34)-2'-O)-methyltransferase [Elusimicrobia bacterium]|nr:tRNA (cytidine(34)-2'-O)-methyltransferase [Elusimicrobiota bacterium]